ncbi:hypothetical protein BASA61_004105 [Batrachochytrium salamandrivorans]|nr:hypothetical protein BASA61_004105 [Batrachochytrium salamandrivorans]
MKPSKTDEPGMGARNKPRVTQACDVCSKKKSKCDGAKPSCCVCTQAGNQCTYTRSTKKRGPPPGYFSGIMNRLKHLESIIADTEGPCDPVSMANGDTSVKLGAATADTTTAADTTTTADTTTNTQTQFDTEVLLSRLEAYLNVQKPCPPSYEQDVNVGLANIATNGQSQAPVQHWDQSSHPSFVLPMQPIDYIQSTQPMLPISNTQPMQYPQYAQPLQPMPYMQPMQYLQTPQLQYPQQLMSTHLQPQGILPTAVTNPSSTFPTMASHQLKVQPGIYTSTCPTSTTPSLDQESYLVSGSRSISSKPLLSAHDPSQLASDMHSLSSHMHSLSSHSLPEVHSPGSLPILPDTQMTIITYLDWFNTRIPIFDRGCILRDIFTLPRDLVMAMCALAATAPRSDGSSTYNAGDSYYLAAKASLDENSEDPSAFTVATAMLLAYYAAGSGRGTAATVLVATGLRIAQKIKLDREQDASKPTALLSDDSEFHRRLWFQLVDADFSAAFATGMPFLIADKVQKGVIAPTSYERDMTSLLTDGSLGWMGNAVQNDDLTLHLIKSDDPKMADKNMWIQMIKLQGLARRVVDFVRTINPDVGSGEADEEFDEDLQRSILDKEMQDYYDQLPAEMKVISETYYVEMSSPSQPSWRTAYLQCLYLFVHMSVHSLVLLRMAGQQQAFPQSSHSNASLLKSRNFARQLSQFVQQFLNTNAFFHHVPPFIGRIIYHTALVQILLMRCMDANVIELNSIVDVHIQALRNISLWYLPCVYEVKLLEAFRMLPFKKIKPSQCPRM